MSEFGYIDNFS